MPFSLSFLSLLLSPSLSSLSSSPEPPPEVLAQIRMKKKEMKQNQSLEQVQRVIKVITKHPQNAKPQSNRVMGLIIASYQ